MSDKFKGLYVSFDTDISSEDLVSISSAIKQFKMVADVEPIVSNLEDWMARTRLRSEALDKASAVLYEAIMGKAHPFARWSVVPIEPKGS